MFGLSDRPFLQVLENKIHEYLNVKVFFDKRASSPIFLSNEQAYAVDNNVLMHQKILVTDNAYVFLGSAKGLLRFNFRFSLAVSTLF